MSIYAPNTEHVSTVNKAVRQVLTGTHPVENVYDRVLYNLSDMYPAGWWDEYDKHHEAIDRILNQRWFNFAVPQISDPDELAMGDEDKTVYIGTQLNIINESFLSQRYTALKQLYKLESVDFNPVYNYDRHSTITDIRTGSEQTERSKEGSEISEHTDASYSDVTTVDMGQRERNTEDAKGARREQADITDTKTHQDTSYDTNLVNSDTSIVKDIKASNAVTDTTTEISKPIQDLTTFEGGERVHTDKQSFDARRDVDVTTFNSVTDTHTEHTEGNIGVTTSTAMMKEYDNYYVNYSFWEKFWTMWVSYACAPSFDTDRYIYEGWYIDR